MYVLNPLLDSGTQQWNKSLLDLYMELEQHDQVLVALRCWGDEHGSEMVLDGWMDETSPGCIEELQNRNDKETQKKPKQNKPSVLQSAILTCIREVRPSLPTHKQNHGTELQDKV